MTLRFECGNGVALMEYAYGEGDPQTNAAIAAHVATCAACADEVQAVQTTREGLRAWTPPEVVLGFQVTSAPAQVVRPARWWSSPLPAWAQVAAAVVLFASGVGLGALRGSEQTSAAQASTPQAAAEAVSTRDLVALETRLREELTRTVNARAKADPVASASTTAAALPVAEREALLQQVRRLIGESERRQQQELALRTAEVVRDLDVLRRGDLARIERTFGQMEGTTGVQVEQQRQLLNYLMRVSQRQP
jgi:hypothetical protein